MLFAVALLASAAPSAAAISLEDVAAQEDVEYANGMVREATKQMRLQRGCEVRYDAEPSFTDAAPSERLLSQLSLLRRPAIPEDLAPATAPMMRMVEGRGVYRNWYRMGRAADGREYYLVTAQDLRRVKPLPHRCLRRRHALLLRMVRPESRRIRTLSLRAERRANREEEPAGGFPAREQLFLFQRQNGTVGLGGYHADVDEWEQRGLLVQMGVYDGRVAAPDRMLLVGVIPDGVTSIELRYPRRADRGPYAPDEVYESALRIVAPVQDNLMSVVVDRASPDAIPSTMVWRAADGSVVRTVRNTAPGTFFGARG